MRTRGVTLVTVILWPARLVFSTSPTLMLAVVIAIGSMWYRTISASTVL